MLALLMANKKDIAYGLIILALVWCGWWLRGVYDDHLMTAQLKAQQAYIAEQEQNIKSISTAYEALKSTYITDMQNIDPTLETARANDSHYADCPVSAFELQALGK